LAKYAPGARFDSVIADESMAGEQADLESVVARLGGRLLVRPVRRKASPGEHDSLRLAAVYREIFS
ncbi:MAG: hypothetical protein LBE08_00350, partial [Bifidobacteriaceae bacterium]|jgi:hypothetical protein|nr:hypothetical protein [Bifidobacteriaceae bacterium]